MVFSDAERERYLNCDVYTHSADIPTQNTICLRHFTQRKFYCRTWQCETPRCPLRRQIPRARDCSYCPSKSINFTIRIPVHIVLVNFNFVHIFPAKWANFNIAHTSQFNLPNVYLMRLFFLTDTCTRWGKIYNTGDNYRCQDGSNFCLCIEGENTISTRMATSVYSICRWFIKLVPVGQRTCYMHTFFSN